MQKVIIIDNDRHPRTGGLFNGSKYSFIIDGKRWPSVDHYLYAKRFEGTLFEEEIRKSPTIFKARRLATTFRTFYIEDEYTGIRIKKKVYGGGIYHMRNDWNEVEMELTEIAIEAKLKQHPHLQKLLVDTGDATLSHKDSIYTGPILEKLRPRFSPKKKEVYCVKVKPFHDPPSSLTPQDEKRIDTILKVSTKISGYEGWGCTLHPEMVEDALWNLMGEAYPYFIKSYQQHIQEIKWSDIYNRYPNYEKIVNQTYSKVLKIDPEQNGKINISILIAYTIWWLNNFVGDGKFVSHFDKPHISQISLPKGTRWYRKNPPKIPKVLKSPAKKRAPRKKKEVKPIIKKCKDGFYVSGSESSLAIFSSNFLSIGAKVIQKGSITKYKFPKSRMTMVKKLLTVSEVEKPLIVIGDFVRKKISSVIDLAIQITFLRGEVEIDSDTTLAASSMQSVNMEDITPFNFKLDHSRLIDDVLSSRKEYQPYHLSSDAKDIILKCCDYFTSLFSGLTTFDDCIKRARLHQDHSLQEPIGNFNSIEVTILKAIHTLASYFVHIINYTPSKELFIHCIKTVAPPTWRKDLSNFLTDPPPEKHNTEQLLELMETFDEDDYFGRLDLMVEDEEYIHLLQASLVYLTPKLKGRKELLTRLTSIGCPLNTTNIKPMTPQEMIVDVAGGGDSNDTKGITILNSSLNTFEYSEWIVVIADASSTSLSLSKDNVLSSLYHNYPYADIYSGKFQRVPGTVYITKPHIKAKTIVSSPRHRYVAQLISRFSDDTLDKILDTEQQRQLWFQESLQKFVAYMMEKRIPSIMFSSSQVDDAYQNIIGDVVKDKEIMVYILTEDVKHRKPSTKIEKCKVNPKVLL